jgi:hypothetical protein
MNTTTEQHVSDFFKYAGNCKKIASIEDVFLEWAYNVDITLNELGSVYSAVEDKVASFFEKEASVSVTMSDGTKLEASTPAELKEIVNEYRQQKTDDVQPVTPLVQNISAPETSLPPLDSQNQNSEMPSEIVSENALDLTGNPTAIAAEQPPLDSDLTTDTNTQIENSSGVSDGTSGESNSVRQELETGLLAILKD